MLLEPGTYGWSFVGETIASKHRILHQALCNWASVEVLHQFCIDPFIARLGQKCLAPSAFCLDDTLATLLFAKFWLTFFQSSWAWSRAKSSFFLLLILAIVWRNYTYVSSESWQYMKSVIILLRSGLFLVERQIVLSSWSCFLHEWDARQEYASLLKLEGAAKRYGVAFSMSEMLGRNMPVCSNWRGLPRGLRCRNFLPLQISYLAAPGVDLFCIWNSLHCRVLKLFLWHLHLKRSLLSQMPQLHDSLNSTLNKSKRSRTPLAWTCGGEHYTSQSRSRIKVRLTIDRESMIKLIFLPKLREEWAMLLGRGLTGYAATRSWTFRSDLAEWPLLPCFVLLLGFMLLSSSIVLWPSVSLLQDQFSVDTFDPIASDCESFKAFSWLLWSRSTWHELSKAFLTLLGPASFAVGLDAEGGNWSDTVKRPGLATVSVPLLPILCEAPSGLSSLGGSKFAVDLWEDAADPPASEIL